MRHRARGVPHPQVTGIVVDFGEIGDIGSHQLVGAFDEPVEHLVDILQAHEFSGRGEQRLELCSAPPQPGVGELGFTRGGDDLARLVTRDTGVGEKLAESGIRLSRFGASGREQLARKFCGTVGPLRLCHAHALSVLRPTGAGGDIRSRRTPLEGNEGVRRCANAASPSRASSLSKAS